MSSSTPTIDEVFAAQDFNPVPRKLLRNFDNGGLDFVELAQELKDNSDDAKPATGTHIYLIPQGPSSRTSPDALSEFAILDDGPSLSIQSFFEAIRYASDTEHTEEDTGKFGTGMNNSLFGMGSIIHTVGYHEGLLWMVTHNINLMIKDNTLRPTSYSVDRATILNSARTVGMPAFLLKKLLAAGSGLLHFVQQIKSRYVGPVKAMAEEMCRRFSFAYYEAGAPRNPVSIHYNYPDESNHDQDVLHVQPVDPFYHGRDDAISYRAKTTLHIYKDGSIYEVLTENRTRGAKRGRGGASTDLDILVATSAKPLYFKLGRLVAGAQASTDAVHKPVLVLPDAPYHEIQCEFIELKEAILEEETNTWAREIDNAAKRGLWFYRNNRLVGSGLTLGEKTDDWHNRIRMRIQFSPALDEEMAMRTQKQMPNHLANDSIADAIRVLYRQQSSGLIHRRKKELERKKKAAAAEAAADDSASVASSRSSSSASSAVSSSGTEEAPITPKKSQKSAKPAATSNTIQQSTVLSALGAAATSQKPAAAEAAAATEAAVVTTEPAAATESTAATTTSPTTEKEELQIADGMLQLKRGATILATIPGFGAASHLRDWLIAAAATESISLGELTRHLAAAF